MIKKFITFLLFFNFSQPVLAATLDELILGLDVNCKEYGRTSFQPLNTEDYSFKRKDGRILLTTSKSQSRQSIFKLTVYDAQDNKLGSYTNKGPTLGITKKSLYPDKDFYIDVPADVYKKIKTGSVAIRKVICKETATEAEIQQKKDDNERWSRIYNNCYIDKMPDNADRDMKRSVEYICREIADDPSFFESMKYD